MKVLVIASHCDDETLGCGGTISKHSNSGDKVTILSLSNRAYNHEYTPDSIAAERHSYMNAQSILGISLTLFGDLKDERLDERLIDVIIPIEHAINQIHPDIVYTHHAGDVNQDHRAVYAATMVACRITAAYKVPRLLSYEVPSSTVAAPSTTFFNPNYYVNISQTIAQKLAALTCYERELRQFPHPRSLKGISILAAKRGMESGFEAAEAFMILRDLSS